MERDRDRDRDKNYWGQAAVTNDVFWGQGAAQNKSNWGISQFISPSGETNISGKQR
jgi:hypothetical protein